MKKLILLLFIPFFYQQSAAQCDVSASASSISVRCGQPVTLSAFGQSTGTVILNENFNSGGFGPGWGSTPGAVNFSNPCGASVDGTPYAWMDDNTSVPRTLQSTAYNLLSATAGVTICFDLMFASQGNSAPCEGPDEPDEGVFLQYSIDGGANWVDIHYFDPNGGNDPQLTNWNNWCFVIPTAALTSNTIFRWFQDNDSGADYDHWGIDNVEIYQNDVNTNLVWLHDGYAYGIGNPGGVNPTPVVPTTTTTYTAQLTTGTGATCTESVTVTVLAPIYDITVSATPNPICLGDCANITATAQEVISPASTPTFENDEFDVVASGNASVNINVTGLNTTSLNSSSITQVVINGFTFSGSSFCTSFGGCPCGTGTVSFGQTCTLTPGSFTVTLTAPGGCTIILAPAGLAGGGYSNTVFVPVGGTALGGGFPAGGPWNPSQPFSNLNGCNPNGVWTLSFNAPGVGLGIGTLSGWSISFNDPAIYGPVTYAWSPTTNMTGSTTLTPTVCPTATTTYNLTASSPTPGCPTGTQGVTVTVNNCTVCATPPTVTITPPAAVCAPATVNLASAVSGIGTSIVTYHATNADAAGDVSPISTTVSTSGTYYVRVEDPGNPLCYSVQTIAVTINAAPVISVTPPSPVICPGGSVSLTASGGGGYTWANATGLSATTGATVIASPATTTTYTVTGTAVGCTGDTTVTVTVSNSLVINVTPASPTICPGGSTTLTATGAATYAWANATGLSGTTGTSVTASPATTTTYTVTGTTGGCTGDTTVTVTVSNNLVISVTPASPVICPGGSTTLTASGAATYAWANAAGLSGTTGTSVTASPATTTTYTVTGTTGGCTGDTTVTVTVSNNLVISVTPANPTICPGGSTTLTASGAATYAWANAAGLSGTTGTSVTASPATTTTYTVTGTTGGCTGDTTVTVNVNSSLTINVTPSSATICPGDSASLTASGAGTYAWATAAGLSSASGATVNASPATTTTYTVTGTSGSCTADTTVTVTVANNLTVVVTPLSASICAGDSTSLTASGASTYTWATAAGLSATSGATVSASPATTTTYTVTGTSGSCTADTTVTVTVNPNPVITVTPANPTICAGSSTGLTASGAGAGTYTWAAAAGLSGTTTATVTASPSTTTTYTVTGTNGSCTADTTVTVTVTPLPTVSVTASPSGICTGGSSVLTATGATTYLWSPSATLSASSGTIVTATPPSSTVYTVIGSNGTCNANSTVTIIVTPITIADAGFDDTICAGQSVVLNASGGNTYTWNPPFGLSDPNIANPVATPPITITYTVSASNSGLCATTDVVTVYVNPLPTVSAGPDALINIGETVILQGYGDSLLWTESNYTLSCYICPRPSANPIVNTVYILTAVDTNGCVNRDTVFVEVTQESALYIPSAFTPNSDGSNDIFYPEGYGLEEIHMMIFNRWGEKIFDTSKVGQGWDGTYKGELVQQDVYSYVIYAKPYIGNKIRRIGSVTVVR